MTVELVIPFNQIFAGILAFAMGFGIIGIIWGAVTRSPEVAFGGFLLLFGADFICALGSFVVANTPTNGVGVMKNGMCFNSSGSGQWKDMYYPCIFPLPSENPYVQQPVHPIAWTIDGVWIVIKTITGAIKVEVT
jgi:hypothetical protein